MVETKSICSDLEIVFGPESTGETAEERARTSNRIWIRSQDHLSHYEKRLGAPGYVMTSVEALECCGLEKLMEAIDYVSAIIVGPSGSVPTVLAKRRAELGLSIEDLVAKSRSPWDLTAEKIRDAESLKIRTPMDVIYSMCLLLDLDVRSVGFK